MRTSIATTVLLFCAALTSCSDSSSVVVDLGVIVKSDAVGQTIDHPTSAMSGADILITVRTFGDDCTWVDRTEAAVVGLHATIKPFDKSNVDSVCADTIFTYAHPVTIQFDQVGTATITVLGYDEGDRFGTIIERSSSLEIP